MEGRRGNLFPDLAVSVRMIGQAPGQVAPYTCNNSDLDPCMAFPSSCDNATDAQPIGGGLFEIQLSREEKKRKKGFGDMDEWSKGPDPIQLHQLILPNVWSVVDEDEDKHPDS